MLAQQEIQQLVTHLQQGNLILYPTETVWGLGCDALNPNAIEQLNQLKKRKSDKSYVLLLDNLTQLKHYVEYIPRKASGLVLYHDEPLTIIYKKPIGLPHAVLAEDGSVAIRITKDPFCKALIEAFGRPIVSTSANISGEPYPNSFHEISQPILDGVHYAADHNRDIISSLKPSTIVALDDNEDLIFLRKGY